MHRVGMIIGVNRAVSLASIRLLKATDLGASAEEVEFFASEQTNHYLIDYYVR